LAGASRRCRPCIFRSRRAAKKVLELSLREALQGGCNYIGTEHVLLALIREGDGVAAQVLRVHLGEQALSRTRQAVLDILQGYQPPAADKPPEQEWPVTMVVGGSGGGAGIINPGRELGNMTVSWRLTAQQARLRRDQLNEVLPDEEST
jgi:ATP-dependent Clp protease ATP-binding subunit ClpA